MTASRGDIEYWLDEAKRQGARYLIVGLDPFDYENFPIYIMPEQEIWDRLDGLRRSGNSFDEVYDLSLDIDMQLRESRAMHLPPRPDDRPPVVTSLGM